MATLFKEKGKSYRVQFVDGDKRRRSIRLGKLTKRESENVCSYIERIVASHVSGRPLENEVAKWVSSRPEWLYAKLVKAGLAKIRESALLKQFVDAYIKGRTDLKPRTLIKFNATLDYLTRHFGKDKLLREITQGDVDDFRRYLAERKQVNTRSGKLATTKGMSENTIRKHMQIAKQIFEAAKRKEVIEKNPFDGQRITVRPNPERFYFVSREDTQKILEACPSAEWRLIVSLSRYGGLRCPSEHHELRWDDIDWDRKRITVRSPKTEHHEGKESRVLPMFPELEKALNDVWDSPHSDGTKFVISQNRGDNLRTQFKRIIKRAGVQDWEKPFHNMRSTRETELANEYPIHVVCKWIGNSANVAMKHYLQMTDEHFEKAVSSESQVVQKAVQSVPHSNVNDTTTENQEMQKAP